MDKNEMIRMSFDYILRLEDAIIRDIKIPYGDHSNNYFDKQDFIRDLNFAYAKLHECLGIKGKI